MNKIGIFIVIFLLSSFTNFQLEQNIDGNIEVIGVYNSVLSNLNKIYGKGLKFIYVNDSIFSPKTDKWFTLPGALLEKFKEKDLVTLFVPNSDYGKFSFKGKLDIPCFLNEVKSIKEGRKKVSITNDGRIISFSSVNISKNKNLALVFVQVIGFQKIDYISNLIVLEKIHNNWYISFIQTYEMT